MYINEVLQLDMVSGSIKKIDLFLADCNKQSTDYYLAYSYRALIMHNIGKTNEALKALYTAVSNLEYLADDSIVSLCDAIIKITMDVNRLDQTKKYIMIKKKYLKVSKSHLYTKDMICYYLHANEYGNASNLLGNYLNDEISNEEKIWSYENLARIYYKEYRFDKYLEISSKLEPLYLDILNMKALQDLAESKLEIYYEQGNYIKVINDSNSFLNEFDATSNNKIKVATLLIKSYLLSKDYRKASIIESNYEEFMKDALPQYSIEFAKAALDLYTQTNSLVSIQQYQNVINELSKDNINPRIKKKTKEKAIIIPNISSEEVYEQSTPILERKIKSGAVSNLEYEAKDIRTVYVSKAYDELAILFNTINSLDENTKFREIFRITGIELSKFIPIKEMYILSYQNQYVGIHYKKERAYDKYPDFESLEDTINFLAINHEQEIYLNPESVMGIKNIVTGKPYEQLPYGVSIPIIKEDITIGSISYFSDVEFLQEDMTYEIIKLVTQMLNTKLLSLFKLKDLEKNNKRMFFIYENMSSGVKEVMDDFIHLSKKATDILGCLEDMTVRDYEVHIHASDLPKYQEVVKDSIRYLNLNNSIEYRFKKNNEYIKVKETFYPSYNNGIVSLYSLIEDVTIFEKTKNELVKLAYTHPVSKLESELKLIIDIKDVMPTKKFSLVLLDIHDFKIYSDLYGINFANQLIYATANELKKAFENEFNVSIYHLDRDRYALLLKNINDRRVVDALLMKKLIRINNNLKLLNNRLSIYFNCGVFRVAKNSPILDEEKIISYANDALTDAKEIKELNHNISHYDSQRAKLRFNENQLITHISESIDHGKIGLSYKQVADIKNNEIFAYYANISLDNYEIDESYMKQVIKRRNLEELIDKYMISTASKELKMLYDELKTTVPIMIEISNASLEISFASFIEQQERFYHSTKKNIIFIVEDASNSVVKGIRSLGYKVASSNLMNLYHSNIDYFILNLKETGYSILKEIKDLCQNKQCELIVGGVDTKEELERVIELDVLYLFGNYYRKSIRIKKLIDKHSK